MSATISFSRRAPARRAIIHKTGDGDEQKIMAKDIVIASGRRGADWLEKICAKYDIAHKPGPVDIGVRVEVRNEVMEELNHGSL
jgi:uncharacterized FAD-dependent dehydrogenase